MNRPTTMSGAAGQAHAQAQTQAPFTPLPSSLPASTAPNASSSMLLGALKTGRSVVVDLTPKPKPASSSSQAHGKTARWPRSFIEPAFRVPMLAEIIRDRGADKTGKMVPEEEIECLNCSRRTRFPIYLPKSKDDRHRYVCYDVPACNFCCAKTLAMTDRFILKNQVIPLLGEMQFDVYKIYDIIRAAPRRDLLEQHLHRSRGGLDINSFHMQCCGGASGAGGMGTNIQVHRLPDLFVIEQTNIFHVPVAASLNTTLQKQQQQQGQQGQQQPRPTEEGKTSAHVSRATQQPQQQQQQQNLPPGAMVSSTDASNAPFNSVPEFKQPQGQQQQPQQQQPQQQPLMTHVHSAVTVSAPAASGTRNFRAQFQPWTNATTMGQFYSQATSNGVIPMDQG